MIKAFITILSLIILSCCCNVKKENKYSRMITDATGREVYIKDTIDRVIALNESSIKMISYLGATDIICGIEEVERRGVAFSHIFANPEILKKPIIGPLNGGDAELIITQCPELIVISGISSNEADDLQRRLKTPVFVIDYGDINKKRDVFFNCLESLGEIFHKQERAQYLINYINSELDELQKRVENTVSCNVYLGGISYKGRHDILSTDPYYPPFDFVNQKNISLRLNSSKISHIGNTTIDIETLIEWNPDIIFIDQGGYNLVKNNFGTIQGLSGLLKSYNDNNIYLLWPFYMYHSNFETMIINAWSVGKTLYPERFDDIDLKDKISEILIAFIEKDVSEKLIEQWGEFRNITKEL